MYLSPADFAMRTILPKEDLDALTRLSARYGGDELPGDVLSETGVGLVPASGGGAGVTLPAPALLAAMLAVDAAVPAADVANYATVSVWKRTAGGAPVLLARSNLNPSGLTALSPGVLYGLALQPSVAIAYGDQLTWGIAKTGTGALLPAVTLYLPFTPTFVDARLAVRGAQINARLKKRYAVPFADPSPEIVLGWQEALVTLDCYRRRGYNPGSAQDSEIQGRAAEAEAQLREAADSKDGLFDLPLLQTAQGADGISVGGPLAYTEASPFVSADRQQQQGVCEDATGLGSYGGQ